MNYFKSAYSKCVYSQSWYGTLDWAPPATILLYDDNECFCIGHMEGDLPNGVVAITEAEANEYLANAVDTDGVWFGDKLENRWNEEVINSDETPDTEEKIPNEADPADTILLKTSIKHCPICRKVVCKILSYDNTTFDIFQGTKKIISGISATTINLTCPDNHKVKVTLSNG